MEHLLNVFKGLSDETRVRILFLLTKKTYCVCELTEILDLSQPKISKHLTKLKELGLVQSKRDARFIEYSLNDAPVLKTVLNWLDEHKDDYQQFKRDLTKESTCVIGGRDS